jgi:hypothetical protein
LARVIQVKPIILADTPTVASGTDAVRKYEIGVKIAPTAQSDIPGTLYAHSSNSPSHMSTPCALRKSLY